MSAITSQNVVQAIVKLVAAETMPALVANLVMGNLVNRDFEAALANAGDAINIVLPPTMVANNVSETGSVQTQNPSAGNAQIVLNTHVEASYQIPDVTKVLASPDLLKLYMQPAVNAVAEKIESDLLGLWPLFTANAALGGTSTMDEARVDSAEKVLFDQKVPQIEPKFLVVASSSASAMRQIPRFSEYQMVGAQQGDAILSAYLPGGNPGLFGRLKDFYVFRSQLVANSTNNKNLAFHKNAIGLAMRRLPQPLPGTGAVAEYVEMGGYGFRVVLSFAPNTLATQVTIDALYGCSVIRNSHGVVVASN